MSTKLHFDFGNTGFNVQPAKSYAAFKNKIINFLSPVLSSLDVGYIAHPLDHYHGIGMLAHPAIYPDALHAELVANRAANARIRAPLVPPADANDRMFAQYDKLEEYTPLILAAVIAELPADVAALINTRPELTRTPAALFQFLHQTYGGPLTSQADIDQLEADLKSPIDDTSTFNVATALFDARLARLPENLQLQYNIPSTKISTFYATMHPTDANNMMAKLDSVHPNRLLRTWANATDAIMAQHFDNFRNDRTASELHAFAKAATASRVEMSASQEIEPSHAPASAAAAKGPPDRTATNNACPAHPRMTNHTAKECALINELVALDTAYKSLQTPTAAQRTAGVIVVTLANGLVNGCVIGKPATWKKVHTAITGYEFPSRGAARRGNLKNKA